MAIYQRCSYKSQSAGKSTHNHNDGRWTKKIKMKQSSEIVDGLMKQNTIVYKKVGIVGLKANIRQELGPK